ncbi:MBL fold metallo-hydrolase [Paenibacillus baekrokdamisoli]|uniref:MBL fold metallo-hydrolase n=1 Tax=Paenibacillus baekrokdamisoli TaxID=1712516 RepID=A0A3G9JCL8_9BACL|nr:MBL fold metallo-hydrolase [Paenibacillus baekrokdamisoli]MBB3069948.1 L-ascorbate metabolism protein UlaG (beta-lactamase superfamily) [Paenibacillus baekrokdamisoli]BBH20699.1 MBL fold metallo-hydrolase [Paenibacillus baekrokdamisoli]
MSEYRDYSSISIQYIGQVGLICRRNGFNVAIDPFLTGSEERLPDSPPSFWVRRYEPPIQAESLTDLDLVLCTHEHSDHLDPETLKAIAAASPACQFAAPRACLPLLAQIGIPTERLQALKVGTPLECGGSLIIHPIPAWHEEREVDEDGWDRYLGYLLDWDGIMVYHAGDTLVTEKLIESLHAFTIDLGFLPINGRDLFRNRLGIDGNMNAREAAGLARELKMETVVPLHFDLFPNNSEGIAEFVDELFQRYQGQKYHVFQPGEIWIYMKRK